MKARIRVVEVPLRWSTVMTGTSLALLYLFIDPGQYFLLYRRTIGGYHFYVRSRRRLSPRMMDAVVSLGQLKTCILHSAGWTEGPRALTEEF